jgi:hypothetical protein
VFGMLFPGNALCGNLGQWARLSGEFGSIPAITVRFKK